MRKLEVLAIIAAILVVFGTPAAVLAYQHYLESQDEITIIAKTVEDGSWSPSTIHVKQGQTVRLRLASGDVEHGLLAPGLNLKVDHIGPGKFQTVEFLADQAGTFPFFCTVLCSAEHGHMVGQIIVEPSQDAQVSSNGETGGSATPVSNLSVPTAAATDTPTPLPATATPAPADTPVNVPAVQAKSDTPTQVPPAPSTPTTAPAVVVVPTATKAPASTPTPASSGSQSAGNATNGRALFSSKGCAGCHGSTAHGGIGPDLTKLKDYSAIAPTVRNGKGMMPAFNSSALTDAELQDIIAFLQSVAGAN